MRNLLLSAEHYCEDETTPVQAIYFIHKMLEYIKYLEDQDSINTKKLGICRSLNAKYKSHVLRLIEESEEFNEQMIYMSPSNFDELKDE